MNLKPDYVGFVFAPSKRRKKPKQARQMILDLEPSIKKVGIFVDAPKDLLRTFPRSVVLIFCNFMAMKQASIGKDWQTCLEGFADKK